MGKVHGKTKIDRFSLYLTEKLNLIKCFDDIRLIIKKKVNLLITVDIKIRYYLKV